MAAEPALVADRQRRLLAWAAAVRRDLPWRHTRDPWAVLVSELMLQQTQVSRVVARYGAFLAAYPTPAACAAATPADLVRAWDGLGYNRRALHLHRAAQVIVDRHAGVVPSHLDDLLRLPGVGPYTARAVLVFAFERDHGVLDTNASRFLARAVAGHPLAMATARRLADAHVPAGNGWEWNQAVLDLGAMVCTKRSPRCGGCPIAEVCAWAQAGFPRPDPSVGSAGGSGRQSRFDGSDRQGRGRLIRALRTEPVDVARIPDVAGWPHEPDRARRVADTLVRDGLAEYTDGTLTLPT